jgi:hypothetical protein
VWSQGTVEPETSDRASPLGTLKGRWSSSVTLGNTEGSWKSASWRWGMWLQPRGTERIWVHWEEGDSVKKFPDWHIMVCLVVVKVQHWGEAGPACSALGSFPVEADPHQRMQGLHRSQLSQREAEQKAKNANSNPSASASKADCRSF